MKRVFLTALGLYKPLVDFASAGATIPLTGFGFSLAKGVEKAISAEGLYGILYGGISGTAGGISVALLLSFLWAIIFKSKKK